MLNSRVQRRGFCLLVAAIFAVGAAGAGVASAESMNGYLHNLAMPPRCALSWETPDPSVPVCQLINFGAPRLALASQSVILRISDVESSRADCAAYSAGVTTTFTVDDAPVPITTQHCRFVPELGDLGELFWWWTDYRYLIPAGSLAPGVHTVMWTATYNTEVSYSLGCTDPSGRCTIPAGTVINSPTTLTITP